MYQHLMLYSGFLPIGGVREGCRERNYRTCGATGCREACVFRGCCRGQTPPSAATCRKLSGGRSPLLPTPMPPLSPSPCLSRRRPPSSFYTDTISSCLTSALLPSCNPSPSSLTSVVFSSLNNAYYPQSLNNSNRLSLSLPPTQ